MDSRPLRRSPTARLDNTSSNISNSSTTTRSTTIALAMSTATRERPRMARRVPAASRAARDTSRLHGKHLITAHTPIDRRILTVRRSNECKRRKIKCNGQTPCQRCGNLNLECVYAPNCCNGFKDSQEYKDMAAHMTSLQEQVNMLFDNLNNLRGSLGHPAPPVSQHIQHQQQPPPSQQQAMPAQPQSNTPIDPSLQNHAFGLPRAPSAAPMSISPSQTKSRSFSQQQTQTSYRGPTSTEFSFGVADNSLQTMGITDGNTEANGDAVHPLASLTSSDQLERQAQLIQDLHDDKDPIYSVAKEEALRLCRKYEDEVGVMYPVLDINTVMEYTDRLYSFIDAARRNGLVQQGFPGADAIDDENTIILKMIIACASTMEHAGGSELGRNIFESPGVREAVRKAKEDYLITHKAPRLLVLAVCSCAAST